MPDRNDSNAGGDAGAIYHLTPEGKLRLNLHPGQWDAWRSEARYVVVLAGTQSGKTVFGPLWLWREIKRRGPGDYLVVTPSFPLLEYKALPAFRGLFERTLKLGRFIGSPIRKFVFSQEGLRSLFPGSASSGLAVVYFGHAQDPEGLEAATVKAAWLDEVGQKKFKLDSWRAIQRRLAVNEGRALFTTTPYNLGWFKQQVVDRSQEDPHYQVIHFSSTLNPAFRRGEYERMRKEMPDWKFRLFYDAEFERPAGLIYDAFNQDAHIVERFKIPDDWPRYLGLDFGGVNTVGVFYAQDPKSEVYYLYRTYRAGGRTAEEHATALLHGEPEEIECVGGSRSEDQWRREFGNQGLYVMAPPISDVEVGILRVYGYHKRGDIKVFADLEAYLDEKLSYSRILTSSGEATEEIENKSDYHHMDAERYLFSYLERVDSSDESIMIPPQDPFENFNYDDFFNDPTYKDVW